ncbi:hypothetical protein AUJ66_02505 [Candidatus Desantisbacteria bacterium CG1_02_38_46]|nr:MAG: hypothetical protein AUJ66_02505 [Candidatus Desantisbacteria bacterium CG1_02_38_46]
MPQKLKVYLDTSVPNAYFDQKDKTRKQITRDFWLKIRRSQIFISDLVIKEISATNNKKLRNKLLRLVKEFKILSTVDRKITKLAKEYVRRKIIPAKYLEDAIHIGVATVNHIDVLVSWNFEHIVKLKTKKEVNTTNLSLGYDELEIIEPAVF